MGFKPSQPTTTAKKKNPEDFKYGEIKYPVPEEGSRPARVSLIVDLGVQEREDFEDPKTGEVKEQKPVHQVAILADLTKDVVNYGGDIGEAQYRLAMYSSFAKKGQKAVVKGTAFTQVPPAKEGGVWTFHPNSLITKLAKATGTKQIVDGSDEDALNDITLLLGKPFNATVEVKRRTVGDKTYENVNFKGCAPVPDMSEYGVTPEQYCPPLAMEPRIITFDDCTEDDVKFIRWELKCTIVKALNYEGSQIQKVFQKMGLEAKLLGDAQPEKVESKVESKVEPKVASKEETQVEEPEPVVEEVKPAKSKKKIPFGN